MSTGPNHFLAKHHLNHFQIHSNMHHLSDIIKQKSYENIIYVLRRHPITFIPQILFFLILAIIPIILYFFIQKTLKLTISKLITSNRLTSKNLRILSNHVRGDSGRIEKMLKIIYRGLYFSTSRIDH